LRDIGFGVLRKHPLKHTMVQAIYTEWLEFFNHPAKHRCIQDPSHMDGYFSSMGSETTKGH
jgi:isopenicillin N synthase-like dioxygenase